MTTTLRRATAAIGATLLLTACSGEHEVDLEQWQQDLDDAGYSDTPAELLAPAYENELCNATADEIAEFLAMAVEDDRTYDAELQRINFENACPDQVATLEEALVQLEGSKAATAAAHARLPEERTNGRVPATRA